jgi:hypothetical protein
MRQLSGRLVTNTGELGVLVAAVQLAGAAPEGFGEDAATQWSFGHQNR